MTKFLWSKPKLSSLVVFALKNENWWFSQKTFITKFVENCFHLGILKVQCQNPGLGIRSSVFWANRWFYSFVMSNLSDSLTVTLLIWATWAIRSQLLNCFEQSERIAHSCSFDLSKWAMSEWATSQPWNQHISSNEPAQYCNIANPSRLLLQFLPYSMVTAPTEVVHYWVILLL